MISCEKAQKLMLLEASGELDTQRAAILRRHVSSCRNCAKYPETAESVAAAVRQATGDQRPDRSAVQSILRDAKQPKKMQYPRVFIYPVAAAALLLMAAGAWFATQGANQLSKAEKMHTIIGVVSEEQIEPLQKPVEGKKRQIEQLAGHLLSIEGLAWEQESTDPLYLDVFDEPDSTSLRWNNTPSFLLRKCG